MDNGLLMQAHQAVQDVIAQFPEGVAIDQIERTCRLRQIGELCSVGSMS